ncbi:uncharacterized protein LOC127240874 [Andrographis paniculata]|uniref:uncharacterized protein LOC127240874 n=1 Tax=Andrographis paniculata TaxID=175694 RepID=UPI0021E938A2|nr:uncharacterized protein LOC127240874 [Andrographis paniculata]
MPYLKYAKTLIELLGDVSIQYVPRKENGQADALAKLASTLSIPDQQVYIPIRKVWMDSCKYEEEECVEKEAEAVHLKEVKKETVADFIRVNIIYRYGVPRCIITDNGRSFANTHIDKLCEKFGFQQKKSSMYYALANELTEAFNKTLCNLLKKVVSKSKRDWHDRIGEALWAYRTTFRTPTQATPYSLVYGVEAVLPLERQIPSLRIALQKELTTEENVRLRLEELEALDEKRLQAQQRLECYQARLS